MQVECDGSASETLLLGRRKAPPTPGRAMAGIFIRKWSISALEERSGSQEHSIDLCRLLGQPTPAEADPERNDVRFVDGPRAQSH